MEVLNEYLQVADHKSIVNIQGVPPKQIHPTLIPYKSNTRQWTQMLHISLFTEKISSSACKLLAQNNCHCSIYIFFKLKILNFQFLQILDYWQSMTTNTCIHFKCWVFQDVFINADPFKNITLKQQY